MTTLLSAEQLVQQKMQRTLYLSAGYSLLGTAVGSRLGIRGSAGLLPFLVQSRNPICPLQAYKQHLGKRAAAQAKPALLTLCVYAQLSQLHMA